MTVTPIPGEYSRFFVSSESRSGVDHVVDMDWRDEKWMKPVAMCSCEEMFCKHKKRCKHVEQVIEWLNHEPPSSTGEGHQ
jgi:leucyl-tRNA synthetase